MLLRMSGCGTPGVGFANRCVAFLRRLGSCLEVQFFRFSCVVLGFFPPLLQSASHFFSWCSACMSDPSLELLGTFPGLGG